MIAFFPTPYADELAYSLFARYHVHSGHMTFRATAEDIFQNKDALSNPEFFPALTEEVCSIITYHISREKYEEICDMGDYRTVSTAVCCLPYIGIDTIKCYEEEDFAEMNEYEAEIYRMAQKIAPKIENLKEMLSLIQLFQEVNAFKI